MARGTDFFKARTKKVLVDSHGGGSGLFGLHFFCLGRKKTRSPTTLLGGTIRRDVPGWELFKLSVAGAAVRVPFLRPAVLSVQKELSHCHGIYVEN